MAPRMPERLDEEEPRRLARRPKRDLPAGGPDRRRGVLRAREPLDILRGGAIFTFP